MIYRTALRETMSISFDWATSGGCSFVKLLLPSLSQTVFEPGTFHRWARLEVSEVQFVQRHRVTYQRDWIRWYIIIMYQAPFFKTPQKVRIKYVFNSVFFITIDLTSLQSFHQTGFAKLIDAKKHDLPLMYLGFELAWPTNPFPASSLHLLLMAVMGAAKIRGAFVLSSVPGRHTSQQPPGSICGLQRCNGRGVSLVKITISNGAPEWAMI